MSSIENLKLNNQNTFTTNIILVVFLLIGLALIPKLTVKLNPGRSLPALYVNFSYYNASPQIVEKQVTSKLEGLFSTVKGLEKLISQSGSGWGSLELQFDKKADIQQARFEVLGLIRQIYPDLPQEVSYPRLSKGSKDESKQISLLTYTLNSPDDSYQMLQYVENKIQPALSKLKDLANIQVYGSTPYEWEIVLDKERIKNVKLSASEIIQAINAYFEQGDLGMVLETNVPNLSTETQSIRYVGHVQNREKLGNIPVGKSGNRIIRLASIAEVKYKQEAPKSYFRINGLTALNMVLYASNEANQLKLANEVFREIEKIKTHLPDGYSLIKTYDASEFIRKELNKTYLRTFFSVLILMLFVLLINRDLRYLLIICISLFSNIVIAVLFYYLLGLEIHIYSLAGITVSFGIIIDNTIIMIDHLRTKRNKHIFLAVLAATLTTIGALTVIFFLNDAQKIKLLDFALVIIINLGVSLFIALFFIQALMDKIPLKKKSGQLFIRRKRIIVKFNRIYEKIIQILHRRKLVFILILLIGFGLPHIFIPNKVEGKKWYHQVFNKTLGNQFYVQNIKPQLDKYLGGALGLFVKTVREESIYSEPGRTSLYVNITLQEGGTIEQLNAICIQLERFLGGFEEIDQFQLKINSENKANFRIYFKPEFDNGSFPFLLKSQLESKAVELTSADFGIYGVGRGFSNALHMGFYNSSLYFSGYNYHELLKYAERAKDSLLLNRRIKDVLIRSGKNSSYKNETAHFLSLNKEELLLYNENFSQGVYAIKEGSINYISSTSIALNNKLEKLNFRYSNQDKNDFWQLKNAPLPLSNAQVKLKDIGAFTQQKTDNLIYKENQQYLITLAYNFIGPMELGNMILDREEAKVNTYLPLGYKAFQRKYSGWWDKKDAKQYFLIFVMIAIIYVICAILLESLVQPLVIIAMIPVSFIGVFLSFSLFDFPFDQGGYASFLLLSGLLVNSALYIINDLNNLERNKHYVQRRKAYIKAYNEKIIPISLTIVSTILGLSPFLFFGQNEPFWFSLAIGTTSGLLFSVFAIVFVLPVFLKRISDSRLNKKRPKGIKRI